MTASDTLLPPGFAALEQFAGRWAGDSAAERARLRAAFPPPEMEAFYNACRPLVEAALAHLDATPLADHDRRDRHLMRLILTFAHVSLTVEVQRDHEPGHRDLREHMRIVRAPADADRPGRPNDR